MSLTSPRRVLLPLLCLSGLSAPVLAQTASLVKDINETLTLQKNANPSTARSTGFATAKSYLALGNDLYFVATGTDIGTELYKTDGTTGKTVLIKDIQPGQNASSSPFYLTAIANRVFFRAVHVTSGFELWVTDGTAAGTRMVKDIRPGPSSSSPVLGGVLNGKLYFSANDGTNGDELWVSDGTDAGTFMLRNIRSGSSSSSPRSFAELGGKLYFSAFGANGRELWVSNGTTVGTIELKNIQAGTSSSSPELLTRVGSQLLFRAWTSTTGSELWRTDGTTAGTQRVADINTGRSSSYPDNFLVLGTPPTLLFSATGPKGNELYASQGTATTTLLLKDINTGTASSSPRNLAFDGAGAVYFSANDGTRGQELWRTNGTTTLLAADINTGAGSSSPDHIVPIGSGLLLLAATGPSGDREPMLFNRGTGKATVLKDIHPTSSSNPSSFTVVPAGPAAGKIVFSAFDPTNGTELRISDGTTAGTKLLKDLNNTTGTASADVESIEEIGGLLYFRARDSSGAGSSGYEPWVSDGTAAGTRMLKDIWPGTGSSSPGDFAGVPGTNLVVFRARGSQAQGSELWVTNGTEAGTKLLMDMDPRTNQSGSPQYMTAFGRSVYFSASNGTQAGKNGWELWVTNGTAAGTRMVADIFPGPGSSSPRDFARVPGTNLVVFSARRSSAEGFELWSTTGTVTTLVKDIDTRSFRSGSPQGMTALGGLVFFGASNGTQAGKNGRELWSTNGTAAGTTMVKDIRPGTSSSSPFYFAAVGGLLYFRANDGSLGNELWVSNGTSSGTRLFADIRPGSPSSSPSYLTAAGSRLFFGASDGVSGSELWTSDGTLAGTRLVSDILPGPSGSSPFNWNSNRARYAVANGLGQIFFTANDGVHGRELWTVDKIGTAQPFGTGCGTGPVTLASSPPVLGKVLTLSGAGTKLNSAGVLLLGSRARISVSLGFGCRIYVSIPNFFVLAALQSNSFGTWSFDTPIPLEPSLAGSGLRTQAVFPATAANPLDLTNAMDLLFGF